MASPTIAPQYYIKNHKSPLLFIICPPGVVGSGRVYCGKYSINKGLRRVCGGPLAAAGMGLPPPEKALWRGRNAPVQRRGRGCRRRQRAGTTDDKMRRSVAEGWGWRRQCTVRRQRQSRGCRRQCIGQRQRCCGAPAQRRAGIVGGEALSGANGKAGVTAPSDVPTPAVSGRR